MDGNALAELGMASELLPSNTQDSTKIHDSTYASVDNDKDYFVCKDGVKFAGTHLLIELWGASRLDEPRWIDDALCDAARAAKATILHSHFHHFSPNGGVSGVVVLAESHISIHSWPERGYAAIDIFMCGECNPYHGLPILKDRFGPTHVQVSEHRRGLIP